MAKDNVKITVEPETPKWRFYCNACTGRAFLTNSKEPFEGTRPCSNCGTPCSFDPTNFIKLDPKEDTTGIMVYPNK